MKQAYFVILIIMFSSCANKHMPEIEAAIRSDEIKRGNDLVSFKIVSQRDSTSNWYVVDYTAIVNGNHKSFGHLIFGVTRDGFLAR